MREEERKEEKKDVSVMRVAVVHRYIGTLNVHVDVNDVNVE